MSAMVIRDVMQTPCLAAVLAIATASCQNVGVTQDRILQDAARRIREGESAAAMRGAALLLVAQPVLSVPYIMQLLRDEATPCTPVWMWQVQVGPCPDEWIERPEEEVESLETWLTDEPVPGPQYLARLEDVDARSSPRLVACLIAQHTRAPELAVELIRIIRARKTDPVAAVQALRALGAMPTSAVKYADELIQCLDDPYVGGTAARVIVQLPAPVIGAACRLLSGSSQGARDHVLWILGHRPDACPNNGITTVASVSEGDDVRKVVWTLSRLGARAVPHLLSALKSGNAKAMECAAGATSIIRPRSEELRETLVALASGSRGRLGQWCVLALGRMPDASGRVRAYILELARTRNDEIGYAAIEGLADHYPRDGEVRAFLLAKARSGETVWQRGAALSAIRASGVRDGEVLAVREELAADKHWIIQTQLRLFRD